MTSLKNYNTHISLKLPSGFSLPGYPATDVKLSNSNILFEQHILEKKTGMWIAAVE